jgi:putative transposase
MVSPQGRRQQVGLACERGLSKRRACGLIGVARSTLSYERTLPAKDAPIVAAMRELSGQYPRYGYRRIRIFLRRRGFELSWSRTHRIWRQAGLLLPKRRPRRRIATGRPRAHTPFKANMVWAYDFVFDTTAAGQQIKCLTVVDEYTRECLAIDVAGSIRSARVIEVLSRLVSVHGAPLFMRSDNGPEFVSHAILDWIAQAGIATSLSDPGKPWQNGTDESFNGKFRDECPPRANMTCYTYPREISEQRGRYDDHALQTGGQPVGRSGRGQEPQPAICLGRQPLLGVAVQNHEVPTRVPRTLRLH